MRRPIKYSESERKKYLDLFAFAVPYSAIVVPSEASDFIKDEATRLKQIWGSRVQVCDSIADDVQIQAAHDALDSTIGGTLVLLPGTYNTTTMITFNRPLLVQAYGASLVSASNIVQLKLNYHSHHSTERPMTINGLRVVNTAGTGATGIQLLDSYMIRLNDITTVDCDTGIDFLNVADTNESIFLENVWVQNPLVGLQFTGNSSYYSFMYCYMNHIRVRTERNNAICYKIGTYANLSRCRLFWGAFMAQTTGGTAFQIASGIDDTEAYWWVDGNTVSAKSIETVGSPDLSHFYPRFQSGETGIVISDTNNLLQLTRVHDHLFTLENTGVAPDFIRIIQRDAVDGNSFTDKFRMRMMTTGDVQLLTATNIDFNDIPIKGALSAELHETTTPTARTDYAKIYTKSDNCLYFQDGAGTEHTVTISP